MKTSYHIILSVVILLLVNSSFAWSKKRAINISSPNGKIRVEFFLDDKGAPYYTVKKQNTLLIKESKLGFILKETSALNKDFRILKSNQSTIDQTWTQPWGESTSVQDHFNRLDIFLEEKSGLKRKLNIAFKVYNDGVGIQYEIPTQPKIKDFQILDEITEFNLAYDFNCWWIPAYGDQQDYEYLYKTSKTSELKESVHTPITFELGDTLFLSLHEAALIDYAGMALAPMGNLSLKADLVPWSDGIKVKASAPMKSPWRTIQIVSTPGQLVESNLILNLNEPNKLTDLSYINPGKYTGIWWGMHIKRNTWESGPQHGATTENVKSLIDFSSKNNIQGVLVEGWNEGWDGDWVKYGNFNFTKPYPDYDIAELSRYAASKGVMLIGHHETGANVENYEKQLEEAFKFLADNGIHGLKTGYVGKKLNGKEFHQSQYMVRHQQKVLELAAKYKVMLDIHEPIKDTGLRRTYPNLMTREGARGTEYEAWSDGNPPNHTTILPFTRCLSGPIDYTPGIFDILIGGQSEFRVHTTLAKQLALYVVLYSPLQMVPDLPEHYEGKDAFKFIQDMPTDWEETKVLNSKIGEYVTIVRKDKANGDWYLGSITNEESRTFDIKLNFLTPGKKYKAEIYADGADAHFDSNPLPVILKSEMVDADSQLQLKLAPGGGQAIRFIAQ